MRRFFIWSALAAVLGLAVAIGGFWAYQHFYARFQPITVAQNQAAIQKLLDESSWLSDGGGGEPLYIIGYRDSPAMQRYEREEAPKLRAAGVEVRVVVFARPDREGLTQSTAAERATVAELWLTRDWTLYQRWTATPPRNWTAAGIPSADDSLARRAVVDVGRSFAQDLSDNLNGAGLQVRYPLIIWRDREGFMKACACSDNRSWAFVRDDLGAPDRIDNAPVDATPLAPEPNAETQSLPYPNLPTIPPAETPADPSTAEGAAPAQPQAGRAPTPRKAPVASQQAESTFF
ncbi:hypothetical protein [Brevundimonas sp. Root1279]|uniref:hypothetical protein n=1 Tax=Brevundimonas sp. Root1279 TaxID=1736443 RepID=UPI0006F20432|nr:hypothetical protein [Brevundimonas sp. Root1279]KQW86602.1 hypothetical protein ASC65_01530 [Brevundimonas sp. Root1279]